MKTVETTVEADANGKARLELELELSPGEHEVVILIKEELAMHSSKKRYSFLELPPLNFGSWPEDLSLRREDMYDDDGR